MSEEETTQAPHPLDGVTQEEIDEVLRDAVCVSCGASFTTPKSERRLCLWCKAYAEVQG